MRRSELDVGMRPAERIGLNEKIHRLYSYALAWRPTIKELGDLTESNWTAILGGV